MELIFIFFLLVSMLHMVEEFFYPGGFLNALRRLNPKLAPEINATKVILINSLQLLLCIAVIVIGERALLFSMSVAGLLLVNGLLHVGASIRLRGYVPGVITGTLLYIPLAVFAYYRCVSSGLMTSHDVAVSIGFGILYNLVPVTYVLLMSVIRRK